MSDLVKVVFDAPGAEVNMSSGQLWRPGDVLILEAPVAAALIAQGRAKPYAEACEAPAPAPWPEAAPAEDADPPENED